MQGYGGGYPAGFGGGYGAAAYTGAGCYGAGSGIRWIYALLILIVIVLQFGAGRKEECADRTDGCCGGEGTVTGRKKENQLIDNSVLFIIIVFLLTLCAGCWGGGCGGYGY